MFNYNYHMFCLINYNSYYIHNKPHNYLVDLKSYYSKFIIGIL